MKFKNFKMRIVFFFFFIISLQKNYSHGAVYQPDAPPAPPKVSLACITLEELFQGTAIACSQKENKKLWLDIIKCHRPMTDWVFFLFFYYLIF